MMSLYLNRLGVYNQSSWGPQNLHVIKCVTKSGLCVSCFQIFVSKKHGFTKWPREVYQTMRSDHKLIPDGVTVQYKPDKGPLSAWIARMEKVH